MALPPLNQDLSGKLAVVTGASSGIGKEIARGLAAQGAEVILACRSLAKAEVAKQEILSAFPKAKLSLMELDLAALDSVRSFAKALAAKASGLDILINNAGYWSTSPASNAAGVELTWATNVLGPNLLTQQLLPLLKVAKGRIINLVSIDQGGLDMDDIAFKKRKFSGFTAYYQAKQAVRMLTWGLASSLDGSGVTANAVNPGLIKTSLNRNAKGFVGLLFSILVPIFGKSASEGADTPLWMASSPVMDGVNGKLFEKRSGKTCKFSQDKEAIKRLEEKVKTSAS